MTDKVDFDALEKEIAELNEIKKAWDKACDRVIEILDIVSKNEEQYQKWKHKKHSGEKKRK